MRGLFIILTCTFSALSLSAQFSHHNAIYLSTEPNVGNYFGSDINLKYVLNESLSLRAGYNGNIRKLRSQPPDYSSGLAGLFAFELSNPWDGFETIQFSVGKIINLEKNRMIRMNMSIGLGYSNIRNVTNWKKRKDTFWEKIMPGSITGDIPSACSSTQKLNSPFPGSMV